MAIQEGDIKLLSSRILDDVPEGGGRSTSIEIVDGASNSIFPDISELDRAYGRVSLRKVFIAVDTPDTDAYYGANVIIADNPDDPNVSCTLFTTNDGFDTRAQAQSNLEAYVVSGPLAFMRLYGDQLIGQKVILAYQREETPLPQVGEVYAISVETGIPYVQYLRITKVDSYVATFTDGNVDFVRRVLTLQVSDPLRQTFKGEEPKRSISDSDNLNVARVRRTSVADSARYYGTTPLSVAANVGDFTVRTNSVFTQLVPSSTQETPILLADTSGKTLVTKAGDALTYPANVWPSGALNKLFIPGTIVPGSLVLTSGLTGTYWPKTDDSRGNIVLPDGVTVVGLIDYANGSITPDTTKAAAWAGALPTVTVTPGAQFGQPAFTDFLDITLSNRGSVYVKTLVPAPAPGTLFIDFMVLGKWYRLYDDGNGRLRGDDAGVGTGTVNYVNGGLVVTLGAIPDVDSTIIYSWGSSVDNQIRTSQNTNVFSLVRIPETNSIRPGTFTVKYTKGGVQKTLTDSAVLGQLAGDGETGLIEYSTKYNVYAQNGIHYTSQVTIYGPRDPGTPIEVSYQNDISSYSTNTGFFNSSSDRKSVSGTVGQPIRASSFSADLNVKVPMVDNSSGRQFTGDVVVSIKDDGHGLLFLNSQYTNRDQVGTIDYATGNFTFGNVKAYINTAQFEDKPRLGVGGTGLNTGFDKVYTGSKLQAYDATLDPIVSLTYRWAQATASTTSILGSYTPPLTFALIPGLQEELVPGSLQFQLVGADGTRTKYVERGSTLYRDPSYANGAGTSVGSVDFVNAFVTLDTWPAALSDTPINLQSCLTTRPGRTLREVTFRTAGAPIRVASLFIQAVDIDGATLTGTAANDGNIAGSGAYGRVNSITGVVHAEFTNSVSPSSVRYNAVVQTTLPLDAGILGLDPVRLPQDGRVPIFRAGGAVVIHHTKSRAPSNVSNGQTINLGRTRLSRIRVVGNDGKVINTGYTTDLDAGTITFNNVSGYAQPVTIYDRIEDLALLGDVQISGYLTITRPLTHDYPLGSLVSSTLIIGDMRARVPILFDQETWIDNLWQDSLNGSPATGTYNDVLAPITVKNNGAITERWVIQFTTNINFNIIGEHVGVIGTGTTSLDTTPLNPANGQPYFVIPAIGWGSGWAAGNILRFNTIGALFPAWIARTIQQGQATSQTDSFTILIRGDIDRP